MVGTDMFYTYSIFKANLQYFLKVLTWQTEAFAVKREATDSDSQVQSLDDASKKLQDALGELKKGFEDLQKQLQVRY